MILSFIFEVAFRMTRSIQDHLFLFLMAETFRKDCSLSQIKSNTGSTTCEVESDGEEVIVSYEGMVCSVHSNIYTSFLKI